MCLSNAGPPSPRPGRPGWGPESRGSARAQRPRGRGQGARAGAEQWPEPRGGAQGTALSVRCLAFEDAAGVPEPLIHLSGDLSPRLECGGTMAGLHRGVWWGEPAHPARLWSPTPSSRRPRGLQRPGVPAWRRRTPRQFKASKPKSFHS